MPTSKLMTAGSHRWGVAAGVTPFRQQTEAFTPMLDHARLARARDETGIKAIVPCPMNPLITDQRAAWPTCPMASRS